MLVSAGQERADAVVRLDAVISNLVPALLVGLLSIAGSYLVVRRQIRSQTALQEAKDLREDRAAWDRQIAEAIAAAMSFLFSVSMLRGGWVVTSARRVNDGRKSAIEINGIMAPAVEKLASLITVALHRDGDQHIVQRAHELGDCLDDLMEVLTDQTGMFDTQLDRSKQALKMFRQAADDRHQEPVPVPGRWRRTVAAGRRRLGRGTSGTGT